MKNARYLELAACLLDLRCEIASERSDDPACQENARASLNQVVDGKSLSCFVCLSETLCVVGGTVVQRVERWTCNQHHIRDSQCFTVGRTTPNIAPSDQPHLIRPDSAKDFGTIYATYLLT